MEKCKIESRTNWGTWQVRLWMEIWKKIGERLQDLKRRKQQYGHFRDIYSVDRSLYHFYYQIRLSRKKKRKLRYLTSSALNGIVLHNMKVNLLAVIGELEKYIEHHSHLRVCQKVKQYLHDNIEKCRRYWKLKTEKTEDLDKVGFGWDISTSGES